MSNVLTTYTLDASQPQAELEKYRRGVIALTSEEEKALIKASATAKSRAADLKREEKALRSLMKLRKETNNPQIQKQYDEQIKKTIGTIQRLNRETRGTANEIKKVGTETKKLGGAQGALVNQLKQVGAAALAAFSVRAVIRFAKASLEAYDVQVKAEAELLRALDGRRRVQERLIKQAQDLQKVTLFGDEETIRAQSTIAAFVQEENAIKRLTVVSQDFATAKGVDLKTAADLITKTFASSTNALSRYGITIEGAAGSSERLEQITRELDKAFGGAAETAARAGLGPLKQLQNNYGDLREEVGGKLIPVLNGLVQELQNLIGKGDEKTGTGFLGAGFAIGFAEARTARFIERLERSKSTLEDWIQIATVAFDPLGLSAISAADNIDKVIAKIEESGNALAQKLIPSLRQAQAELLNVASPKTLRPLETLASLQEQLAEETRIMTEDLERGSDAFFRQAAVVDRLKRQLEALQDPLKAAREAEEAARKEREAAEKAIDSLIKGLEKQRDQLTMTNEEILRNELAQLGANEATIFSTLLLREQVEELKKVEAAKKAQIALGEQLTASVLTDAEKEKMAIDEVNQAYANNAITFETLLRRREQIQAEADERRQKALDEEAKQQAERAKLAQELVDEFAKTGRQLFLETMDLVKAESKRLLEEGKLTAEEYEKIIRGVQMRITEMNAIAAANAASDISGAIDSFKEFLNIIAGDSARFVEFQKVLTGIQIALDTAKAIASVIAAAASGSFSPIELAAKIVAGIAIVATNMAKASALYSGAGDAQAPTFAKGGYTGTGIGRKDHTGETVAGVVHAKEFVINKGETAKYKPMLEAINKGKWPEYFARHYAPFAAIDARPSKAQDKGFAANIAKALQIEFDDRLEGALKRIERKTGTTKVTNLHELGKYFKRNYWGPNTKGN